MRLRRSCLAVPGTSERMLAKAATVPADEVLLDLEDAVAEPDKTDATRQLVVDALLRHQWRAPTRAVRVNGVRTAHCLRDVLYVVERAHAALDCLVVPKVEGPDEVHFLHHLLAQLERSLGVARPLGLELLVESARGVEHVELCASASPRVEALVFGPGDLAADLGIGELTIGGLAGAYPGDRWNAVLSRIVVAARARGQQAIDGPYAVLGDLDGLRESARRSSLLGYDGKWAIHPEQLEPLNHAYAPDQASYERAERLLADYADAVAREGRGALRLGGEMVDEATRKLAEQLVARGRAAGLRCGEDD
jgi:citrate lyase subunit beta/citryl-CoA lyase